MRKFRTIVQQEFPPEDKEVLWLTKDTLNYYNNGSWVSILETKELLRLIAKMSEDIKASVESRIKDEIAGELNEKLQEALREFSTSYMKYEDFNKFRVPGEITSRRVGSPVQSIDLEINSLIYEDHLKLDKTHHIFNIDMADKDKFGLMSSSDFNKLKSIETYATSDDPITEDDLELLLV